MTSIKDQTQHNKNKELSFRERFTRTWCVISVSVIMLWTLWTLLDAFVIPSEIVKTDAEISADADEELSAEEAA